MKKVLIIFLVIVALLAGGVFYFLNTFDANRFKPLIESKLSQTTGKPVKIGNIYLSLKNGVYLAIDGLKIFNDSSLSAALVDVKKISAKLKLKPLLHKQIEITSIEINQPVIEISKNKNGSLELPIASEPVLKTTPRAQSETSVSSASSASFEYAIDVIQINDGTFIYKDSYAAQPIYLKIEDLDVTIKDFAQDKAFLVDAAASFASKTQNINLHAGVKLPVQGDAGYLDGFSAAINLNALDLTQLQKQVPSIDAKIVRELKGKVLVSTDKTPLLAPSLLGAKYKIELSEGFVSVKSVAFPIENIKARVIYQNNVVQIPSFYAQYADAPITFEGVIEQLTTQPIAKGRLTVSELSINKIYKSINNNAPSLQGKLSLDSVLSFKGLAWPSISKTLTGSGQISLREGVVLNYNALREIISKLSAVPGVSETLNSRLPDTYRAALSQNSTLLKPVIIPFNVNNGVFLFNPVTIETDYAAISGMAEYSLENFIRVNAGLFVSRELSAFVADVAPIVASILNAQGLIEVPVSVEGQLPKPKISADVRGITQKIIGSKAGEIVGEILKDPKNAKDNITDVLGRSFGLSSPNSATTTSVPLEQSPAQASSATESQTDGAMTKKQKRVAQIASLLGAVTSSNENN